MRTGRTGSPVTHNTATGSWRSGPYASLVSSALTRRPGLVSLQCVRAGIGLRWHGCLARISSLSHLKKWHSRSVSFGQWAFRDLQNTCSAVCLPPAHLFFSFYQKHLALLWQLCRINLLLFVQPQPFQEESVRALLLMRSLTAVAWLSQDGRTCALG